MGSQSRASPGSNRCYPPECVSRVETAGVGFLMKATLHVRKGWIFWQAIWAEEPLAFIDTHTVYRSGTREGAIEKARRALAPRRDYEVVELDVELDDSAPRPTKPPPKPADAAWSVRPPQEEERG